ncbi:MAG TPA: CHAT domain-containing protein [Herpetosiphonaceae bacterium]
MHRYTEAERQFLLRFSQAIIAGVAPEELVFFSELAEEYFADPTPPKLSHTRGSDPAGVGLNDLLSLATPAALAMVNTALGYLQQNTVAGSPPRDAVPSAQTIRVVLQVPEQRQELAQLVVHTGTEFLIPARVAAEMSELLITALLEDEQRKARAINGWLADHDPQVPLARSQTYTLHFNVALPRADTLSTAAGIDALTEALPPDQDTLEVTVLLETEDFVVQSTGTQTLHVPRTGPSDSVSFAITPTRTGAGVVKAFFSVGNHIFQSMTLTMQVQESLAAYATPAALIVETRGIDLVSAAQLPHASRSMSLIVTERESGYQMIVLGDGGVRRVFINISMAQVTALTSRAREVLHEIVYYRYGNHEQQQDLEIPEDTHTATLESLVNLGTYLYNSLFYHGQGEDARATGDLLRTLMREHRFHIRIIADRFVFPWVLLYSRERHEPIDADGFWGFQHLIACMPEFSQPKPIQFSPRIEPGAALNLSFVYDANLDLNKSSQQQMVRRQREFFSGLPGVVVHDCADRLSLFRLLQHPADPPHIIYFYCHAASYLPNDVPGVAGSSLQLTDGSVTLFDLESALPATLPPFKHSPLVFINACESAKLTSYFYAGFVPYMIARGARGVLGTEVDTPLYFAAAFAQELIARLVQGNTTLGEIVLDLRREFLREKRNVLGLLYTLYSSNDITIMRP